MNKASPNSAPRRRWSLMSMTLCIAIGGCHSATSPTPTPVEESQEELAEDSARAAIVETYQREFGEQVPQPAIHTNSIGCEKKYFTTVAYLPASAGQRRTLALYLAADGRTLAPGFSVVKVDRIAVPPAGRFSVLTVVIAYDATVGPDTMAALAAAQRTINTEHATFAATRRYAEPIVQFDFTNITVPPGTLSSPGSSARVRAALEARGDNPGAFDFLAVINVDPARSEGGYAVRGLARPHFIYMGNVTALPRRLRTADVDGIARSVYHHEVGHHWGWDHDWTPKCSGRSFAPFITSPQLFGWEDLDGDGIPEILDPSPYGR